MLLYRISGTDTWVDWDVLHNDQGYSKFPCVSMTYKKISPWGTDGGSGYKDSQTTPSYFVSGNHGWLLAVSMPGTIGLYPSEATPLQMINGAVVSNAVTMEFLNGTWYLIEAEIANERYWLTESMVEELGWEVYEEGTYEFVFVDSTTGRVVHGVEQLDEMVFVETSPYPIVSKYEKTYDSQQTLSDGAYIDTVAPYYPTKLYIASCADNTTHDQTWFGLSVSNEGGFVRVTNNTGATVTLNRLAIQSMDATDAEVVEVKDGSDNHAWAFKWDDNGTPYWYIEYHAERTWRASLGGWTEVPVGPVLPTISDLDWFSFSGAVLQQITIYPGAGSAIAIYVWGSSTTKPYDTSCSYAVSQWNSSAGVKGGATELSIINYNLSGGILGARNDTQDALSVWSVHVYSCSSNQAAVVTVYNSSNVAYNAFKYTTNGTDYYYVLDGTQTDWTDDLASIGYSLTPSVVLPTVDAEENWATNYNGNGATVEAGDQIRGYSWNGSSYTAIVYDSSKVYATIEWRKKSPWNVFGGRVEVSLVDESGDLYIKNVSSASISLSQCKYAICSSNQATVVTVYNSSNVAYNAFKYTASGTDYYYVLDGTQTDWTDDLESIGYRLDVQFYFYFKMNNYSPLDETFDYPSNNNYWTLRVRDQTDADFLSVLGLRVTVSYSDGPFGFLKYDTSVYSYELKEILRPDGSSAAFNLSDFYITTHSNNLAAELWCNSSYSTPVRSCLISIKPL